MAARGGAKVIYLPSSTLLSAAYNIGQEIFAGFSQRQLSLGLN